MRINAKNQGLRKWTSIEGKLLIDHSFVIKSGDVMILMDIGDTTFTVDFSKSDAKKLRNFLNRVVK